MVGAVVSLNWLRCVLNGWGCREGCDGGGGGQGRMGREEQMRDDESNWPLFHLISPYPLMPSSHPLLS